MNKIKQVNRKGVLGEGDANETLGEGLLKRHGGKRNGGIVGSKYSMKTIPASRGNKCKGPEAEDYLAYSQKPMGLVGMEKSARERGRR